MQATENPLYASVILDHAIDQELDYLVPEEMRNVVHIGSRVEVPVKHSMRKGTIWKLKQMAAATTPKPIEKLLSEGSILTQDLATLAEWMAKYYCAPLYKVLKTILPSSIRSHMQAEMQTIVKRNLSLENLAETCQTLRRTHPKQAAVLDIVFSHPDGIFLSDLLEKTKSSVSPVHTLVKKGILCLEKDTIHRMPAWKQDYFLTKPKTLNPEQKDALGEIQKDLDANSFAVHLLYGITGSGKTEVYLQAIDHAIRQKKGVIFLVPEIILTSQTIERLKSRFEEKIAVLHHRLSEGEKRDAWHHILSGEAPIVIGARSAIFCPVPRLGLIIVDEEHETAYKKTEEGPCYHARDVAVMRAKLSQATVILGSATPSLETYRNALEGKYHLSILSKRPDLGRLPQVQIVDMKQECLKQKRYTLFSDPLIRAIKARLAKGEQTLLLLNRRGYHTSQICLRCSYVPSCPHCDTSLTFHLSENVLACHLCDHRSPALTLCPSCSHEAPFKFRGAGTEMVEKALYALFPECRVLRMDADTTRLKGSHESLFRSFRSGKADILVGTQMIAKGLHFPSVTLVGILHADITLNIPDFRSSEALFQLVTQAAGRAGRSDLPGEVIIQTFLPSHPTLIHASTQRYIPFYEEESEVRKLFQYPPYIHLIKFVFSGPDARKTQDQAEAIRSQLIRVLPPSFELLPVIPTGHAKIQDQFRFQFLMKTSQVTQAYRWLLPLQKQFKNQEVRCLIDVDPISTFF